MKKEYKIVLGDQILQEGIMDKSLAESIFWGRVRTAHGQDLVLYRDDKIVYKQVARHR